LRPLQRAAYRHDRLARMTIIELGDLTAGSQERPPREFDRRILRRLALVVVGALTVLGVTASARPQPTIVRTLWSIPFHNGDQFMVDGETVYTKGSSSGARFIAYRLDDARPLWSMPMPEDIGWPSEVEAAHVLLIPDRDGTFAVDTRTGAELWHLTGTLQALSDDSALLVDQSEDGSVIRGMRLVRIRDGGVVWTRLAPGTAQLATGGPDLGDPGYVVVVRPNGATEVIRWADGVRLAAGRTDWRPGVGFDGSFGTLSADGRNIYVRLADGSGSSLTAYALDTLSQVWRQDGAARVSAYPCGPVICSMENDNFAAYDIVTGATRWRAVGVQDASPVSDGRMLIADGAPDAYVLVDLLTGARIASLGLGTPIRAYDGRTIYLLRHARSPYGKTSISRVDLASGAVSLRGSLSTFADFGCEFTADRAVCPTTAARLVVTAVG
jgi:outer membrane protein assembly factor BamB